MVIRNNIYSLASRTPNANKDNKSTKRVTFPTRTRQQISTVQEQQSSSPFMRLLPRRSPNSSTEDETIYDFYFPFEPTNVTYENLADEIAELPRPGATPIVVFKQHRLMRVSFEFLVAIPFDGLMINIEDSLQLLRKFSSSGGRDVQLFNMDTYLTSAYPYKNRPSGAVGSMIFKIADMTVTSTRRTKDNRIAAATVSITLVESAQNPGITVAKIPKIHKRKVKKKEKGKKKKTKSDKVREISDVTDAVLTDKNELLFP